MEGKREKGLENSFSKREVYTFVIKSIAYGLSILKEIREQRLEIRGLFQLNVITAIISFRENYYFTTNYKFLYNSVVMRYQHLTYVVLQTKQFPYLRLACHPGARLYSNILLLIAHILWLACTPTSLSAALKKGSIYNVRKKHD